MLGARNLSGIMEEYFKPDQVVDAYINLCKNTGRVPVVKLLMDGGNVGYQDVSTGELVSGENALELIFSQVD